MLDGCGNSITKMVRSWGDIPRISDIHGDMLDHPSKIFTRISWGLTLMLFCTCKMVQRRTTQFLNENRSMMKVVEKNTATWLNCELNSSNNYGWLMVDSPKHDNRSHIPYTSIAMHTYQKYVVFPINQNILPHPGSYCPFWTKTVVFCFSWKIWDKVLHF